MELLIWLTIYTGVIVYAWFKCDKLADDLNPYNFRKRD